MDMKSVALYLYEGKSKAINAQEFSKDVETCVEKFRKKYGYYPEGGIMRQDEYDEAMEFTVPMVLAVKGIPHRIFQLGPVVTHRRPRTLMIERSCVWKRK